jgi:Ca2+:H+ antiporter
MWAAHIQKGVLMELLHSLANQTWFIALMAIMLIGGVLSAVHHAEVVAHKTGEPYGALVLAISVTIIEVSLIVSMMLSGHDGSQFIARDAVFATVMIVLNGVIGLCIFIGGLHHHEMSFRNEGTNSALAVLTALATFILVMPIVTISTPGPDFTKSQLAFAGIASFALYAAFLFFQTVSHRDYYLPKDEEDRHDSNTHAEKPSNLKTAVSVMLLIVSLVVVVGLAELRLRLESRLPGHQKRL